MYYKTQTNLNIKICESCSGSGANFEKKNVCANCDGFGYLAFLGNTKYTFPVIEKKIYKVPVLFSENFSNWIKILFFAFLGIGIFSGFYMLILIFAEFFLKGKFLYNGEIAFFETFFWIGMFFLTLILYFQYEFPRPRKIVNENLRKLSDKELDDKKRKFEAEPQNFSDLKKLKKESLSDGVTMIVRSIVHRSIVKYGIGTPSTFFLEILHTDKGKSLIAKIGKETKSIKNEIKKIIEVEKKFAKENNLLNRVLPEGYLSLLLGIEMSFLSNQKFLGIGAFILGTLKTPSGRKILDILNISEEDLENLIYWINVDSFNQRWHFWKQKTINWTGGIALDWGYGYTINLDKYVIEMSKSKKRKGFSTQILGRVNEINELERILARGSRRGNVLLVGDPGTGKGAIVKALAEKISTGNTIKQLQGKKIVSIDIGAMIQGGGTIGAFEEKFTQVIKEASEAGNVIIFIGEVHEVLDASTSGIDAGEFLRKGFEYGVQVIFSTTYEGFKKYIEPRSSLTEYLQIVHVKEMTTKETMVILEEYAKNFEKNYKIKINYHAIKSAVELSERFFNDRKLPAKAIDLLEDAVVEVSEKLKKSELTAEIVYDIVSQKTGIPISGITQTERDKLMNLENEFSKYIIGQKEATSAISDVLRRNRAGVATRRKPIGSFLFIGPTGVGKTEVVKVLANIYFGSEKDIVRFDMSEFQTKDSIYRLIGNFHEGAIGGQLTEAIRKKPFSIILLDEIEKAHQDILNVFLQVLDDGRLSDSSGRVFDMSNTIIIATSNVGSKLVVELMKENLSYSHVKEKVVQFAIDSQKFSPEFLNRFDSIICFTPLTTDEAQQVAKIIINSLKNKLEQKRIYIEVSDSVIEYLVKIGYNSEFGARSMRRIIQEKLESFIAKKIVSGEISTGAEIFIKEIEDLEKL
ncbi:MAG: hypothetical protein Fur0024_4720 [Patescibacteria group bacterium]